MMTEPRTENPKNKTEIATLYAGFQLPITTNDCGKRCAPYNEYGVPFCCDTRHAVPTAYIQEWVYLNENSDLWHLWDPDDAGEKARLQALTPPNQVLIECTGYLHCQRNFRSLTCRAFPFYPYIDREGNFTGLAYYWQYEDRCWVINHLEEVSKEYIDAFVHTFDLIFTDWPREIEQFRYHSKIMRQVFGRRKQNIPLLHRNGNAYAVNTSTGHLTPLNWDTLPKFGPYQVASQLKFSDEKIANGNIAGMKSFHSSE